MNSQSHYDAGRSDAEVQMSETFTETEINAVLKAWLEYGKQSFGAPGHRGYFSGDGWAARCLRYHLEQRLAAADVVRRDTDSKNAPLAPADYAATFGGSVVVIPVEDVRKAFAELITICESLLGIVRLQNGNLHDDINQLQEQALTLIAKAKEALNVHH